MNRILGVTISGKRGAGKTMLAHLIASLLRQSGHAAIVDDLAHEPRMPPAPRNVEAMEIHIRTEPPTANDTPQTFERL